MNTDDIIRDFFRSEMPERWPAPRLVMSEVRTPVRPGRWVLMAALALSLVVGVFSLSPPVGNRRTTPESAVDLNGISADGSRTKGIVKGR
ncbi:MAG: hypothetical protein ACRC8S_06350 [Fimbriiglobus sp.]